MAATANYSSIGDNSYVKSLAESTRLKHIPAEFTFANDSRGSHSDSIPIIDVSRLASTQREERSKVLHELAKACEDWGFFVLVNHGISESVMKGMIDASLEYFDLPEEEKRRNEAKSPSDPIKSGTSTIIDTGDNTIHLWRDFVKCYVHPDFHSPEKPKSLRDAVKEYSDKTRPLLKTLMLAIGENLGLEEGFLDQSLRLDKGFQLYAANYYPQCPQPDLAIGIPEHTDHGLLTFLLHNGVAGLQIRHKGEWFNATSPKNSILVNTADHLEIVSNGRYKSVRHRAVVNSEAMRISIVMANGPAPDVMVAPAPKLVEEDGRPFYRPMKYIEYVETMLSKRLNGKTSLDCIKIQDE